MKKRDICQHIINQDGCCTPEEISCHGDNGYINEGTKCPHHKICGGSNRASEQSMQWLIEHPEK
jgi:hypothetical protein